MEGVECYPRDMTLPPVRAHHICIQHAEISNTFESPVILDANIRVQESQDMLSCTSDDLFAEEPLLSVEDHAEIQQMRSWLNERRWTEAESIFSDHYIHTVLNASKDGKKRSFEYAALKLQKSLEWRRNYGTACITSDDVSRALAPNHMWWEGEDKFGRPILYVRPADMDLSTYTREEYVRAHVYLIEQGLKRMGAGVSTFVLVVDASGLGAKHFDLARDKQLLQISLHAYPDRLGALIVGPLNGFIRTIYALLSNLMPKRLSEKIVMSKSLKTSVEHLLPKKAPPPPFLRDALSKVVK